MDDKKKNDIVSESEEKKTAVDTAPVEEKETKTGEEKKEEVEVKKEEVKVKKEETTPAAAVAEEPTVGEDVEVPRKFQQLVEQVESMSVLELHELVKLLEKKFGVSAAAVAVVGSESGGDDGAEEKTEFTVELVSDGGAKIPTMKVVKEILGLGLKEAKDLVEGVPSILKEGVKKEDAEEMKKKLEEAGAQVVLK